MSVVKENDKGQCVIECEVILSAMVLESSSYNVITAIKETGKKQIEDACISVYLASENEGLWDISKRLNVMPEQLLKTNEDLEFPLKAQDRVVIYRQK